MSLHDNQLREALEILFAELQKKGMLPPQLTAQKKEQIIDAVMENLTKNNDNFELTLDSMRDKPTQANLGKALICEFVGQHNPAFKFDYRKLFSDTLTDKDKKALAESLEQALKKEFEHLAKLFPGLKFPTPDQIKKLAEALTKGLTNSSEEAKMENSASRDATLEKKEAEEFSASLKNLFGGIDPRFTGMNEARVLELTGNLSGIVKLAGTEATSDAFIDKSTSFDAEPDPLGIENSIRVRLDEVTNTIEETFDKLFSSIPSPGSTPKLTRDHDY